MRFKGLDLNMLQVLDLLLELQSVSRTAERLGLTQPAVSAGLGRLRDYFQDELLVAQGRQMNLTPFAEMLQPRIKACLVAAEQVVAMTAQFDPVSAERTFRIIGSDYLETAVLVHLSQRLAHSAPGVCLEFVMPDTNAAARFERNEADLYITPAEFAIAGHPSELLYEEEHVVAGWNENSLFSGPLTEHDIFAAGHVAVSLGSGRERSFADRQLDLLLPGRRIEAVTSSFSTVPWLLMGTSRISLMHRRLAEVMVDHFPIRYAPIPFPFPIMRQMAQYHLSRTGDEGVQWLLTEIRNELKA